MTASLATMAGLAYSPTGEKPQETTKGGIPIYNGTAVTFDNWELIVTSRDAALGPTTESTEDQAKSNQQRTEYASRVLEGL